MPKKSKTNYSNENMPEKDRCQTPSYAITPILPYLNPDRGIWEPAMGEGLMAQSLQDQGLMVYASDILYGDDFFEQRPDGLPNMTIVTNPPFSLKFPWLKRCYELGTPFALLMPADTLFAARANTLFQKYGIEIIIINPRIDFKMPNKGWGGLGSDFATAWFTWKLNIGKMISFYDITEAKNAFKKELQHPT